MQLGDTQQAISILTPAASLPENATPDADYDELGNIYMSMAEKAGSDGERERLRGEAAKMWRNALQTPAIAPATRDQIQSKLALADGVGIVGADPNNAPDVMEARQHRLWRLVIIMIIASRILYRLQVFDRCRRLPCREECPYV
jgi:hypothetical protein